MKLPLLFLLTATFAFGEVSTRIIVNGSTLPATVQGIPWIRASNYGGPGGNPDQGIGLSYRGKALKIDIYIYDSLNADWAKLPLPERIKRENESLPAIFKQFTDKGAYSDVKFKPVEKITAANRVYDHTEMDFTDKDAGRLNSHYYLAELNGKILKIRISRAADSDPAAARAAFEEIAAALAAK
jgi:hypothetical protein